MNKRQILSHLIIVMIIAILCLLFAYFSIVPQVMPGAERRTGTAKVIVFADLDGDGEQDAEEPPLPNALVLASANIHGIYSQYTAVTDEDGKVTLTVEYTHYFDVGVMQPCGYTPTTPVVQSVIGTGPFAKQVFGFQPVPELSQSSTERVTFHLWQDVNLDGIWQEEERPLSNTQLFFSPDWEHTTSYGFDNNALSAVTDEMGQATLEVGNSCGTLLVAPVQGWEPTTVEPHSKLQDAGEIAFRYDAQTNEFTWGMSQYEYFSFSTSEAHHPEGMGEWQISLDIDGTFTVDHIVFDERTKYGPFTLSETENQELWRLIAAANIEELPRRFTRPGIPDETAYSFSLHSVDDVYLVDMWVDDAEAYPALLTLLEQLFMLSEVYTGVAQ